MFGILADEPSHQKPGHVFRRNELDQTNRETTGSPGDCPDGSAFVWRMRESGKMRGRGQEAGGGNSSTHPCPSVEGNEWSERGGPGRVGGEPQIRRRSGSYGGQVHTDGHG